MRIEFVLSLLMTAKSVVARFVFSRLQSLPRCFDNALVREVESSRMLALDEKRQEHVRRGTKGVVKSQTGP